jgi:hypothetical protein
MTCPATCYDRSSATEQPCTLPIGHAGRHEGGRLSWDGLTREAAWTYLQDSAAPWERPLAAAEHAGDMPRARQLLAEMEAAIGLHDPTCSYWRALLDMQQEPAKGRRHG